MITHSSRRLVAGLAVVVAAATLAMAPSLGSSSASAVVLTCGSDPSPSATYTTCAFYDDFTGTPLNPNALDGTKWRKVNSSLTAPVAPNGNCLRTAQVTVNGGQLHLESKAVATPVNCWGFGANAFKTRLIAGGVTTDTKFSETYGRIEFKAAFPADDSYSWSALWMSPDDNTYNPGGNIWPYNGEIDIAERVWGSPNTISTSLHYADKSGAINYQTGDKNPGETLRTCTVATPEQFHVYSAEWTSAQVTFYVDNVQCASLGWDPAGLTPPAPFDKPFNLVATQTLVEVQNQPAAPTGTTRVTDIDWVKYWTN